MKEHNKKSRVTVTVDDFIVKGVIKSNTIVTKTFIGASSISMKL